MDREALLGAAVANNASWCDAICRSHSYPGTSGARVWISARHDLEFYPNAITLAPDATAADTCTGQDPSRRYAVKDSFARLDLTPAGLDLLFEAEWIAAPAVPDGPDEPGLPWDAVTDDRRLARWEMARAQGGGLPVVSYAHGPDLAAARQAGWQALGRLRVWERQPAS